jgi:hypothetical protein
MDGRLLIDARESDQSTAFGRFVAIADRQS